MLSRTQRVGRELFSPLMRRGRAVHTAHLTLRWAPQSVLIGNVERNKMTRVAAVVSSSVARLAVDRNRVKRRMYAVLSTEIPHLPDSLVLVFFSKKGVGVLPYALLATEIHDALSRARLLKP